MGKLIDVCGKELGFGDRFEGIPFPRYLKDDGQPIGAGDEGWEHIPAIDPHFAFDNLKYLRLIVSVVRKAFERQPGKPCTGVLAIGDTGSGKTSTLRQVFARMGLPHVEFDWSPRTEFRDLVTVKALEAGEVVDQQQALCMCMVQGWPYTINEADDADPGELLAGNGVWQDGRVTLPTGEVIEARRGFFVNLTANNFGANDDAGIYNGTRDQNAAVKRRFLKCRVDYASEEVEFNWLTSRFPEAAASNIELLRSVASLVSSVRKAFKGTLDGKKLPAPLSRTEMCSLVEMIAELSPMSKQLAVVPTALDYIYCDGYPEHYRMVMHEIIKMSFGDTSLQPEV